MNIGPTEAGSLSLYQYTALLYGWNKAHSRDEDEVEPPDPEKVRRHMEALANSALSRARH